MSVTSPNFSVNRKLLFKIKYLIKVKHEKVKIGKPLARLINKKNRINKMRS